MFGTKIHFREEYIILRALRDSEDIKIVKLTYICFIPDIISHFGMRRTSQQFSHFVFAQRNLSIILIFQFILKITYT